MNLTIDIGNTRIKIGVFDSKKLLEVVAFDKSAFENEVKGIFNRYPTIHKVIFSSVAESAVEYEYAFGQDVQIFHLNKELALNFSSRYDLRTLGSDRKALIAAAVINYPSENVLIIDLGSCVTYDLVDCAGMHHGGGISPGWQMRIKAMYEFTDRLPKLSASDPEVYNEAVTGITTSDSMYNSTFFGLIAEIDERIEYYKSEFPDLTVILTGGDAPSFSVRLKRRIFAHSNFLLEGLNGLLEHNL